MDCGVDDLPEDDAAVVAGVAIVAAPGEALIIEREVLGDREDGVGQPLDQRRAVVLAHVSGLDPVEAFVEVDVEGAVMMWDDPHGDVGVVQPYGHAQGGVDLLAGEGAV